MHKHTNTQIHKYTNVQIHKHTNRIINPSHTQLQLVVEAVTRELGANIKLKGNNYQGIANIAFGLLVTNCDFGQKM